MKKLLLFAACVIFYAATYSQTDDGFSVFLNKSYTEILKERNDSLANLLINANTNLDSIEKESSYKTYACQESIRFLLFLAKLENNQMLSGSDSANYIENANPQDSTYHLILTSSAFDYLNQNTASLRNTDNAFLDAFPKLKHLHLTGKLVIRPQVLEAMEAPVINIPPLPVLASGNASAKDKKKVADTWLDYIYQVSTVCSFPQAEMKKYLSIEKTKVPDGNLDKLIDLRQKCAMFIQVKYCHK